MNRVVLRKFSEHELGYECIVYPTTYMNPLADLNSLNISLREKINKPCEVLFDLLLCNGDNFNRFVKATFDGERLIYNSLSMVEGFDENVIRLIEAYYKEESARLTKGVLTKGEYLLHCR